MRTEGIKSSMGAGEWALLIALSVLWGGSFFFAEVASSLVMWPLLLVVEGRVEWSAAAPVWLSVVGLAVLSTAVAYVLYFRVLASSGATNLLLVTLLIPVTATFLGVLFLDATLHRTHVAGIAVIALGLSAIDGRLWRR